MMTPEAIVARAMFAAVKSDVLFLVYMRSDLSY